MRRFNFINSSKIWGGEERFVVDLASSLQALRHDVVVYGRPQGDFLQRVAAVGLSAQPLYGHVDYDPRPVWQIPAWPGEEVFIGLTPRDCKLLRLLAYRRPQAQFFWHLGVAYPAKTWEYHWLLHNERLRLLVPSVYLKSRIVALFPQVERRTFVLHNGVDVVQVDTRLARQKLAEHSRVPAQKLFLGIFSRLTPWKGHALLLQALCDVKAAGVDFYLWIVGTGKEAERLKKQVHDCGLTEVVTFTGHQSDVGPWMAGIDVVLLPSDNEPFGYVVLEGMALGKTVMATASGGPLEIIEDGIDGMLVPSQEPAAWAAAIMDVARHAPTYATIGRTAHMSVQKKFSLHKMVANFLYIIEATRAID